MPQVNQVYTNAFAPFELGGDIYVMELHLWKGFYLIFPFAYKSCALESIAQTIHDSL